jgi:hypothetical protein
MRVPRTIVALVAAFVGAAAAAAPAVALEPGVFVDPSSPAGKEYSFPLDALRGSAVGHSAPQGVSQPLFAVGIAHPGPTSLRSGGSSKGSRRSGGSSKGSRRSGGSSKGAASVAGSPAHRGVASSPAASNAARGSGARSAQRAAVQSLIRTSAPAPQVALIAVPVLLAGLALGAALATIRRRLG